LLRFFLGFFFRLCFLFQASGTNTGLRCMKVNREQTCS